MNWLADFFHQLHQVEGCSSAILEGLSSLDSPTREVPIGPFGENETGYKCKYKYIRTSIHEKNIHGKNNSKATNYIHNSICIKNKKTNQTKYTH